MKIEYFWRVSTTNAFLAMAKGAHRSVKGNLIISPDPTYFDTIAKAMHAFKSDEGSWGNGVHPVLWKRTTKPGAIELSRVGVDHAKGKYALFIPSGAMQAETYFKYNINGKVGADFRTTSIAEAAQQATEQDALWYLQSAVATMGRRQKDNGIIHAGFLLCKIVSHITEDVVTLEEVK